jgi:isopentenyldiphosphate isomerase
MHEPGSEQVDVLDDAGQVIGVATRRAMRAGRLPHRCTYLLVFDPAGRLFLHLRTPTKDVYPDRWDVAVGGVLAAGEDFAAGARRELHEELGIDTPPEALFPFRYEDEHTRVQAWVYRVVHAGPFRLQPEEVIRGEFIELTALPARLRSERFCPDGLAVLAEYQRRYLE